MKDKKNNNKTVYVGMSGGVDSSVAAALLKKEGYNVVGVYMDLQKKGINQNIDTIEQICKQLNIPLKIYSLQKEFSSTVIKEFISEYKQGNTPNPCVHCNKKFKFGVFFDKAIADGTDFVATGHYVRVKKKNEKFQLLRGADEAKDQSYFLHNLAQDILSKLVFPIGHLNKDEVREIAKDMQLLTSQIKESQDVCFISNNDVQNYLSKNIPQKSGETIDIDTKEIAGKHNGVMFYTIGQRKGLGIGGSDAPYFVVGKNIEKNELYVGKGENHPTLFKKVVILKNIHWISGEEPRLPLECEVSIRYRQTSQKAVLKLQTRPPYCSSDTEPVEVESRTEVQIEFETSIRAISPGQSAVIYQGETCLGGGIIERGE